MHWIRQRMRVVPFGDITAPIAVHLENGNVEIREVSQCDRKLPDVSTTDLGDLVNAGVDLKRVDSAIYGYGSGVINTSVPFEDINNLQEEK